MSHTNKGYDAVIYNRILLPYSKSEIRCLTKVYEVKRVY